MTFDRRQEFMKKIYSKKRISVADISIYHADIK